MAPIKGGRPGLWVGGCLCRLARQANGLILELATFGEIRRVERWKMDAGFRRHDESKELP